MTLFIKIELNLVYFFTMNPIGFALYGYLVFVCVFGRQIPNPDLYQQGFILIATLIILDVITLSILFFMVLKFESGRDLLYSYVPRDYVISCIGNPGHRAVLRSFGLLAAITSLDLLHQVGQSTANWYSVKNYIDVCHQSGLPTKEHIVESMMLNRTDFGANLGHLVVDPGTTAVKTIMAKVQPPTKP